MIMIMDGGCLKLVSKTSKTGHVKRRSSGWRFQPRSLRKLFKCEAQSKPGRTIPPLNYFILIVIFSSTSQTKTKYASNDKSFQNTLSKIDWFDLVLKQGPSALSTVR